MKKNGARPAAFSFFPQDWLSSPKIMLMTPAEEGAYIRLLCIAWDDPDSSLPDDDDQLARLSRLGDGWHNGSGKVLRECFEPHPKLAHKIINKKLFILKQKNKLWRLKSSAGGRSSADSKSRRVKGGSTKEEPNVNSYLPSSYSPKQEKKYPPAVVEVFEFWQLEMGHPQAKLTPRRRSRIADRLREDYSAETLKQAVLGCKASPFHRGENKDGKVFDDIELICRSGEKVEQFLACLPAVVEKPIRPVPVDPDEGKEQISRAEYERRKKAGLHRVADSR